MASNLHRQSLLFGLGLGLHKRSLWHEPSGALQQKGRCSGPDSCIICVLGILLSHELQLGPTGCWDLCFVFV